MSRETTVAVDAEQYDNAIPDWVDAEEIEVEISAFSDKVYVDFPDFARLERQIESKIESDNKIQYGDNDEKLVSEIETREEAIEYLRDQQDRLDENNVPHRTSQYCADATSVFVASVKVRENFKGQDLHIGPQIRLLITGTREDNVFRDPGDVVGRSYSSRSKYDPVHLTLVEEFASTVAGFDDDPYWQGYKDGQWKEGARTSWSDIAWAVFDKEWDGNEELMLDVGKWMARRGEVVCRRSDAWFPIPQWSRPTGSYVATISDVHGGTCPDCGADKSENWECVKSSNRTRVPDKYKCTECGRTKKGITTG